MVYYHPINQNSILSSNLPAANLATRITSTISRPTSHPPHINRNSGPQRSSVQTPTTMIYSTAPELCFLRIKFRSSRLVPSSISAFKSSSQVSRPFYQPRKLFQYREDRSQPGWLSTFHKLYVESREKIAVLIPISTQTNSS